MGSINVSAAHAFDYIVHRVKFGLTSCEELATTLINELLYVMLVCIYTMVVSCDVHIYTVVNKAKC